MANHPPYITCRATTTKCGHRATNYILAICSQGHINETALCHSHTSYNNTHHAPCPYCRLQIEDVAIVDIGDVMITHLNRYITASLSNGAHGRGGTIINPEWEDLPKSYLHHNFPQLGGFYE